MQHHYAYDLALRKMAGLIQEAELERAAADGRSVRPSGPGARARIRAAIAAFRDPDRARPRRERVVDYATTIEYARVVNEPGQ